MRKKKESRKSKSIPAASHVSKQGWSLPEGLYEKVSTRRSQDARKRSLPEAIDVPRLAFDDDEEKLDDMLQRVNSKIEKLIDSVPLSAPNSPLLKPDTSEFELPSPPPFGSPRLDDQMAQSLEYSQIPCECSTPPPCSMPLSSDKVSQLATEIEERISELQTLLRGGFVLAEPNSDSEPDPENSPAPTTHAQLRLERSAIHFQCEKLKAENADLQTENKSLKDQLAVTNAKKTVAQDQLAVVKAKKTVAQVENADLQRENKSLKEQLAVVKAKKIVAEVAIQTISTSETCQQWAQAPTTPPMSSSEKKVASRGRSPSATRSTNSRTKARVRSHSAGPELTSTQDSQEGTPTPSQGKQSFTIPSSVPASPGVSMKSLNLKALATALDAPNASVVRLQSDPARNAHPTAYNFGEYVQYHKEPMEGGWREFYQPTCMHNMLMMSARKPSRGSVQRMHSSTGDAWHSTPVSARRATIL